MGGRNRWLWLLAVLLCAAGIGGSLYEAASKNEVSEVSDVPDPVSDSQVAEKTIRVEPYYAIATTSEPVDDPILDTPAFKSPTDLLVISVNSADQLTEAVAEAPPGTVIELADGEYDSGRYFHIKQKVGTEKTPFIVRAQHPGKAVIAGDSWFLVDDSAYVVIEGLTFATLGHEGNLGVRLRNTNHSRITANRFALTESSTADANIKWVFIGGKEAEHNRVDHNLFEKKRQLGNFITIGDDGQAVSRYNRIDHNEFRDIRARNANGMEAMRIGTSTVSQTNAFTIVEYNLFEQCSGEAEIVSVKTGGNELRYNTFVDNEGSVTLRHGNGNRVYGNFFLGHGKRNTGGVRIFGEDHQVYNNYFEGLAGTKSRSAIVVGGGDVDLQGPLAGYWRVKRLLVAFNTFVDNASDFDVATDESLSFTPLDTVIANNLAVGSKGRMIAETRPTGVEWRGNILFATGTAQLGSTKNSQEVRMIDPKLANNGRFWQISANSPAIDAAVGEYGQIKDDLVGFIRSGVPDVGATEFAPPPGKRQPLTSSMVGPGWQSGANEQ
jgi:hypothetical protein